jgi:hypothetical protein
MVIQMIERNKNIFIKKAKNLILDYLTKMVWGVFGYFFHQIKYYFISIQFWI